MYKNNNFIWKVAFHNFIENQIIWNGDLRNKILCFLYIWGRINLKLHLNSPKIIDIMHQWAIALINLWIILYLVIRDFLWLTHHIIEIYHQLKRLIADHFLSSKSRNKIFKKSIVSRQFVNGFYNNFQSCENHFK